MLGYFCKTCQLYFREMDLLSNKRCPECKEITSPRLILCGQVMGAPEEIQTPRRFNHDKNREPK